MSNYDGRITLETQVDTKGIKASTKDIENAADKAGQAFKNLGGTLSRALADGDTKTAQLAARFQKATADVEKQTAKVDELKAHLAQLKSGEITVEGTGAAKLKNDFDKACEAVKKTQNEVNTLYFQLDQLNFNALKAPGTGEAVYTASEQKQIDAIKTKLDELEPKLEQNKQKAKELGEALKSATGAATRAEIDKTKAKLSEAENKLGNLSAKAEIAGQKLETSMGGAKSQVSAVSSGFGKLGTKLSQLAKGALIFSAVTKGFTVLRQTVGSALMSNESFRQSLYQLQAAFWTAFAPIYNYIVPAIKTLVNWITIAITSVLKLAATLTGTSYSAMVDSGKKLQEQAEAYKAVGSGGAKAAKGIKKATDEAEKQLAAFDELNILSENKAEADAGNSGGGVGAAEGVPSSAFDSLKDDGFSIDAISEDLQTLMKVAGASLVAIGLLLLFTGNIGLGIGFIAAGAVAFAVAVNAGSDENPAATAETALAELGQYVGGMLAVIGVILLFCGHIPLGIGFIIGGIAALGVSTAVLEEHGITTKVQTFLEENESLIVGVSLALLVLGIVLLFAPASWHIALGLIAAGVVGLASEIAINEGDITEKVSAFLQDNASLIAGVSLALLVLGVVLICCGVITPLSIGLLSVGTAGLATEIALNWDTITTKISEFFQDNAALIVGVSLALLILGIILLFAGASIPLGLGLIAAGGVALAGTLAANWDFITDKIKEVWGNIKEYWNRHIAKYFTAEWWADLGNDCVNGLLGVVEKGLNFLIDKINALSFDVPDWVPGIGGKKFGFSIDPIKIPRLARGAVIPPNREFLAVLGDQKSGTNIEAPADLIRQIVAEELSRRDPSGGAVTINFTGNLAQLARVLKPQLDKEAARKGTKLVIGGAY